MMRETAININNFHNLFCTLEVSIVSVEVNFTIYFPASHRCLATLFTSRFASLTELESTWPSLCTK